MSEYLVRGGGQIRGELTVHGAKNSALPILAATLLTRESAIDNCPCLSDVEAACNILECLGCRLERDNTAVRVDARDAGCSDIPEHLMGEMRSSILFLGSILARCGRARISFPGGCELGPRPVDMHLDALRKLGVDIQEDHGYLDCTVRSGGLRGADIMLPFPSVGATENTILAACTANGVTVIHNAAREPEITDLCDYINACGGDIRIETDSTVRVRGVSALHGTVHRVIPDRIAAATYLCAAAITRGEIALRGVVPAHLTSMLPVLEEMGCELRLYEDAVCLTCKQRPKAVRSVKTMPYPGFPTDAQAPVMAVTTVADGTSLFVENIFESRYKHAGQLCRMGARIKIEGRVAVVEGTDRLHSASVQCTDLRGGAALVVAALAADGTSRITDIKHIDRGYENFEDNLRSLGARITREK